MTAPGQTIIDSDPRVRSASTLSEAERLILDGVFDDLIDELTDEEAAQLEYEWALWRRPNQTPPEGRWAIWFVKAGRGYGKTRTGAETTRERVEKGLARRVGIIAPTAADGRDVMIEGESGLLAVHPDDTRPKYEPSKRRVTWPNGAVGTIYSAEEPERLRGPQHDWIWGDEPASWRFGDQAMSNARLGLRLGTDPRMMLTGTPKPTPWLRAIAQESTTAITAGSTYENVANLAPQFIEIVMGLYEGTRLGRQELHAEFLDDIEGALWREATIDRERLPGWDPANPWTSLNRWLASGVPARPMVADRRAWRVVVGVDPPGETAECGICVAAAPTQGRAGFDHAVVLDDMSMIGRPEEWGAQVVAAARKWNAERVVVESNQGGDMVRSTIHAVDPMLRVEKIRASESKTARAEPVAALYERGWVHHVGFFALLESQMVTWVPGPKSKSPDRLDAMVHALRFLLRQTNVVPATVGAPTGRRSQSSRPTGGRGGAPLPRRR